MPTATDAATEDTTFHRHDRVVAAADLPGVPVGTPGKVLLVAGFTWIRYHVLFDNGRQLGSLDGKYLAQKKAWDRGEVRPLAEREAEERAAREAAAAAAAERAASAEAAGDGGGAAPTGLAAMVPAHLLERSKAARARLTGG